MHELCPRECAAASSLAAHLENGSGISIIQVGLMPSVVILESGFSGARRCPVIIDEWGCSPPWLKQWQPRPEWTCCYHNAFTQWLVQSIAKRERCLPMAYNHTRFIW